MPDPSKLHRSHLRAILMILTIAIASLVTAVSVTAAVPIHRHADPGWDGYTNEYFDYIMGWGGGNYCGQTGVSTSSAMSYLGSRNMLYENCNTGVDLDTDTGYYWTYNSTQFWIEADGGYANDWWDCPVFHSIESHASGTYHLDYPPINNTVGTYIIYQEDP